MAQPQHRGIPTASNSVCSGAAATTERLIGARVDNAGRGAGDGRGEQVQWGRCTTVSPHTCAPKIDPTGISSRRSHTCTSRHSVASRALPLDIGPLQPQRWPGALARAAGIEGRTSALART